MAQSTIKEEGNISIFHLKEDLSPKKVKDFARKIYDLLDTGRVNIVLDLTNTEDICLLGMVTISTLFNRCRQQGGALKICGLNAEVAYEFEQTNLINTVEVYKNAVDAIKSFRSRNLVQSRVLSGSFWLKEKNEFVNWHRLPPSQVFH